MEMGFDASQCQTALEITGGNTEAALNYLLSGDLPEQQQQPPITQQSEISFGNSCHITRSGVSQYSFEGGRSACTAVALEAALTLLGAAATGTTGAADDGTSLDLSEVVQRGVATYMELALAQGGIEHTSCDEVLSLVPRLSSQLRVLGGGSTVLQALTTDPACYASLVAQARALPGVNAAQPIGLVVTKPPETILVVAPPTTIQGQRGGQWLLLDSHSRPHLVTSDGLGCDGAFLLAASDLNRLVEGGLRHVFPPVDMGGGDDMAMMEAMYNAVEVTAVQLTPQARPATDNAPTAAAPTPGHLPPPPGSLP